MFAAAPLLSRRLLRRPASAVRGTRVLVFPHGGMGDSVVFEAIVRQAAEASVRVVAVLPPRGEDYDARSYEPGPDEAWVLRSAEIAGYARLMRDVHCEAEALFFRDGPIETWFLGPPAESPPRVRGCRWIEPYAWLQDLARRGIYPRFAVSAEALRRAGSALRGRAWIGVHCRTDPVDGSRNLEPSDLVETVRILRSSGEARILAVGGRLPAELLAVADAQVAGEGDPSLQTTAAHLAACAVFIGGDSGPAHLAAAVGTSVVSLAMEARGRDLGPFAAPGKVVRIPGERDSTGRLRVDPRRVAACVYEFLDA